MSFANTQYLLYAVIAIVIVGLIFNRLNSNFFKWIKAYWFYERTWTSRLSTLFYMLSLFLMMTALLDLRGPEKKVKGNIPDQRTIILIDASTSMLAEDVRPNRFVKALQLARHFVKNSAGHQISIVLFSDIQKRLLPFTDDLDLIDSRLAALEKTNSVSGGSSISQAIEEAIQYFEFDSSDDDKSKSGNILVFTDAEESEGSFKVNIPSNVNFAVVGLGTLKGASIPLRWEDGGFRGYKTFKGEPVVTKLDESYIKKMGKGTKNFKYWIVNSFSLPTDEINNFFRSSFSNKQNVGDLRIRPVYSHYILIPAIILYCISVLIGRFASFKIAKLIVLFALIAINSYSPSVFAEVANDQKNIDLEIKNDLEQIKNGEASREQILKAAEKLLRAKDLQKANELYGEYTNKNDAEEVRFNQATALLKSTKLKEALPIVQELLKNSKNEELKDKLRKNLKISIQQKDNKEDQKDNKDNKDKNKDQTKDQNKDQKDNKDQKKDGKEKDSKGDNKKDQQDINQKDQSNKSGDSDKQKEEQESKKDKEEKEKEKEKEKRKNENEGKEENDKDQRPSTIEEKEKAIEQKRKMVKTPAMIKQIMNDDRDLQKKMMDTSTNQRGEQKPKRDW